MICGSVNNWPPRYGSVILKLDPNFGTGRITERRKKNVAALLCIRIRWIRE
jgi:hypothetical protein